MNTVRRDTAGFGIESLTCFKANMTKVAVRTIRRDTAVPSMKSLTSFQANTIRVEVENSGKEHSWTWHETTHNLSSQQTRVAMRRVRRGTAGLQPGMESLTRCQVDRTTRVTERQRTVRRDTAGPNM